MREELLKRLDELASSCRAINCPINDVTRDFAAAFFGELPDVGITVECLNGQNGELWVDLDWSLSVEPSMLSQQRRYSKLIFFLKLPVNEFGPAKFSQEPECRLEFTVDGHCKFRFGEFTSNTSGFTNSPAMVADLMYCFLESRHKVRLIYNGFDAITGARRRFEHRAEPLVFCQIDLDEAFKEQERKEQGHFADAVDYCKQVAEHQKEEGNTLPLSVIGAVAGAAAGV